MGQSSAPGNTCLSAVRAGATGAITGLINQSKGCGALSAMVRLIAQGEEIVPAACHTLRLLAEHPHPDGRAIHNSGTVRLLGAALELLGNTPARAEIFWQLGEGWTGDEALAIGVYATGAASSFEDAVRLAANHDGDSDSPA